MPFSYKGSAALLICFIVQPSISARAPAASKKIQGYDVKTYLDAPEEVVTLKVVFQNLPAGPNCVAQSILDATAKQVQIRTTNSDYSKL